MRTAYLCSNLAAMNWNVLRALGLACGLFFAPLASAQLHLNELMAVNNSTDYDDFFEAEDWVEVYNSGGIVNLAGYYLSDDPDSLTKWMFPSTNAGLTTVLPGGHVRIWCDNDLDQGEDHAGFKLSGDGEEVFLVEPDGVTVVDQIAFGPQAANISYGRACDGCPDWIYFDVPTPEQPNAYVQPETAQLYLNEFQHQNATTVAPELGPGGAWLELHNPNAFAVNVANYTLSHSTASWTLPNDDPVGTVIESEGFLLIWLNGETQWGSNHASITVPADATPPSEWTLTGPDGAVVDQATWVPVGQDESYGRSTDGGLVWQVFSQPTPQVSNQLLLIPGAALVINELLSDNAWGISDEAGEREDWFEVHNPTAQPVDLAGYYLTDQWNNPTKFRVPVGLPDSTVIAPGGFMLFWADEDQNQGWNHVNFRLSNDGEHLALRSPDGFTVVDSLNFPAIWPSFSYGRLEDASVPWVFFEQTTPNASNNGAIVDIAAPEGEAVRVHPNPVRGQARVSVNAPGVLRSAQGRLVRAWDRATEFSAPNEPGMYFIHWTGKPTAGATKLLVL